MFYHVLEEFCSKQNGYKIWDYLNIERSYWCQVKRKNKLKLEHYKKICEMCHIPLTDNHAIITSKMVEVYYAP